MADVPEFFSRQVGPLPMGAWLLAVGGGLTFAYYLRQRQPATPARDEDSAIGVGEQGSWLPPTQGPVQLPGGGSWNTEPGPREITNNMQWRREAFNFLIAQGASATAADRALGRYLQGEQLTTEQNALIELALAHIGMPPEGVPVTDEPDAPPDEPDDDLPHDGRALVVDNMAKWFVVNWNTLQRWRVSAIYRQSAVSIYGQPLMHKSQIPAEHAARQDDYWENTLDRNPINAISLSTNIGWTQVGDWRPPKSGSAGERNIFSGIGA